MLLKKLLLLLLQTHEEFRQVMNGYKQKTQRKGSLFLEPNNFDVPKKIDYRELGYVTPVKDQVRTVCAWDPAMFCCYLVVPLNHTERL